MAATSLTYGIRLDAATDKTTDILSNAPCSFRQIDIINEDATASDVEFQDVDGNTQATYHLDVNGTITLGGGPNRMHFTNGIMLGTVTGNVAVVCHY